MPIDLSGFAESLGRGFSEIPPIAIALGLLAGPTVAMVGYRLIGVARRMQIQPEIGAAPFWVCQQCRSVNELRLSRCYRCTSKRDAVGDIEVILDRPVGPPASFEVPVGSPFAALAANLDPAMSHASATRPPGSGPGMPVMAEQGIGRVAIPVRGDQLGERDAGEALDGDLAADDLTPATERSA
jgi:hypothetical protein